MHIPAFSIARLPVIKFGPGSFSALFPLLDRYGTNILLVTGSGSIESTIQWQTLMDNLDRRNIDVFRERIIGEPSPQRVDEITNGHRHADITLVIGLGGGSVLDAAKAVAGLLRIEHSVMEYLEGVGPELPYTGPSVPFIAIPTTAGTGSEATKNAVLSIQGPKGFKKSFRDEQLVAQYAIVDPDLLASCPPELIAANGMDALTQLMESFVSTNSNVLTDALAVSALRACHDGLADWYNNTGNQDNARESMAYASMISGINLAQTGLGSVHGLASPLGAFFPIPHGVVCGTLVASATRINIDAMTDRDPDNSALKKYERIAVILCNRKFSDQGSAYSALVDLLYDWTANMKLQKLSEYGVTQQDFGIIIKNSRGSSMKTNPIVLTDSEIEKILTERT